MLTGVERNLTGDGHQCGVNQGMEALLEANPALEKKLKFRQQCVYY